MRLVGVRATYLVKEAEQETLIGKIVAGIKFVDDYRPSLSGGIDRRYAEVNQMGGCIWYNDTKNFSSVEEGNEFFKQKLAEGYRRGTEQEYNEFVRRCGNLTY